MQPPHGPAQRRPPGYAPGGSYAPGGPHAATPLGTASPPARSTAKVIGCALAALFALGVAFVGFFAVIFLVAIGAIKSSEPYRASVQLLSAHPAVIGDTGLPVEVGLFPTGSVESSTAGGSAELSIDLSGPKGKGSAEIVAHKAGDRWHIDRATWTANGRSTELVARP